MIRRDRPADDAELREELLLAVLAGHVHDVGSPLAAITSNLSAAQRASASLGRTDPAAQELGEILDDVGASTARLVELSSDLRAYAGSLVGPRTLAEVVRVCLRLTRAHLSRRVTTEARVDPAEGLHVPPSELVRALCGVLVALSGEQHPAPLPKLVIRSDGRDLEISVAPGGPLSPEVERALRVALAHLPAMETRASVRDGAMCLALVMPPAP